MQQAEQVELDILVEQAELEQLVQQLVVQEELERQAELVEQDKLVLEELVV